MADPTLPLLVVGAGRVLEKLYAPALRSTTAFAVEGVVDPRADRRTWAQRAVGARTFASLDEALVASRPAGALVIVSPAAQLSTVRVLIDAAIPVLCEKPLALTPGEARALLESSRLPVRLALSRRYWSRYRSLAAALDAPITHWRIDLQTDPRAWGAVEPDTSPTALVDDLLPHAYDIATSVLGAKLDSNVRVEAASSRVRVEAAGGAIVIAYSDSWHEGVRAQLEGGRIVATDAGFASRLRGAIASRVGKPEPVEAISLLLDDFARDIDRGSTNNDLLGWATFRQAVVERL